MNNSTFTSTNDRIIRNALNNDLVSSHKNDQNTKIFEELGIAHGSVRVDIAVINGILHGYELKSDLDTLYRLPEQMRLYNLVFDKITLVVGKNHVLEAIKLIPDWWGIKIAKILDPYGAVTFIDIREPEKNYFVDSVYIARFLWREEALNILEKIKKADGMHTKPRKLIYERLAKVMDRDCLSAEVRRCLFSRVNWRVEKQHKLNGD